MLTNYHTHHYRCRHAKGQIEDFIEEAIKNQYTEIGMSCHVPYESFPELGNRRMDYEDLDIYFKEIQQAQKKYPQIKVLSSLECEYFPKEHHYIKSLVSKTDYLILAQHYIKTEGKYQDAFHFTEPRQLEIYGDVIEQGVKTKFFKILAHPDVFMTLYPQWDEACEAVTHRIAKLANQYDVILEVNANGLRRGLKEYKDGERYPYPSEKFWQIIATHYPQTKVLVNSDCHNPKLLNDNYMKMAREMAKRLSLNVLEHI